MYDVYVPMIEKTEKKYSFEEAKHMVLNALSVLGSEYTGLLEKGFHERWIDIYENEGKRSGAYSWGAYGTHPYVLLNYQGNLNHVFTLAHEMGHGSAFLVFRSCPELSECRISHICCRSGIYL